MVWQVHSYAHSKDLVEQLADRLCDDLKDDIQQRGEASLIVSGGSTPVPLFECLAQKPLNWSRVQVSLADERWVDVDSPDSNAALVNRHLLQGRAAKAQFIELYNGMNSPFDAEAAIDKRLKEMAWPVSAVILGMGNDGHTASLFPGARELQQALIGTQAVDCSVQSRCCAIAPITAPHERMTLTLPALMDCNHLYLHIAGSAKKKVLDEAMQLGAVDEYPIRAFLHQQQRPLDIYYSED